MSSRRDKRRARGGLALAGGLLLLAAACSSQPDLPDMPPFKGTAAYLEMQERIHKAVEAGDESAASLKEGYRAGQTQRGRRYVQQMALLTERMRQQQQYEQHERERFEHIRAEEAQRNYAQYVETLRRKEVLQRQYEAARDSARRRSDSGYLREIQARGARPQAGAGQGPARSSANRTPVP